MVNEDEFLEWTEFAGNYYGTDKNITALTIEQGHNLLLEIDVKGALQVKEKMPEAILIFIEPPSLEELRKRLFKRKTESEEEIQRRLSIVSRELQEKNKFNYNVINNDLDESLDELEKIVVKEIIK